MRAMARPRRTQPCRPTARLLFGALAIKAVALAARRFPPFNGFYRRRPILAIACCPYRRRHCNSWRWIGGAGAARHRSASARRADEPHARPRATHTRRAASEAPRSPTRPSPYQALGSAASRRCTGSSIRLRSPLSASARPSLRPWVIDGRDWAAFRRHHHALGRPSGQ